MAARCPTGCMHVCSQTKNNITAFSENSFSKFKRCALRWSVLQCNYSLVAKDAVTKFGLECTGNLTDVSDSSLLGYHRECYQRFTDINKLDKAEKNDEKNLSKDGKL